MTHTGTQTYHVLNNFPQDIMQEIMRVWKDQNWKEVKEVVPYRFWHYVLEKDHPLKRHFEFMDAIEYYEVAPGFKNSPHLDRGRWCAINIPVEVDTENSFFHCGKYLWLGHYELDPSKNDGNSYLHAAGEKGPKGFFLWDDDLIEKYNLEKPVLFNSKVPHGGDNIHATTNRVIASIGCTRYTYDQIINIIPPEWF